jgi:hypothetical protein|tara:strand:- start:468 stop:641 length:174 start_codon:yes stop_codon:yes gene_type:complete
MATLFKNILLTAIALAVLVIFEQWFGMTVAFIAAGVCFLAYVLLITWRQMRDEPDED